MAIRGYICTLWSLVGANQLDICQGWWHQVKTACSCHPEEAKVSIPQGGIALATCRHDRPEPAEFLLQATCRMGALTSASCPSQTLLVVSVPQRAVRSYRGPPDEHITSWRGQE
jgi:hypothetical protein